MAISTTSPGQARARQPHATAAPATQDAATARIVEFDVMRGLAIVFVVFMHAYFSPWAVTPRSETLVMHVLHLFGHTAVPVFLFISAFLLAGDDASGVAEFASRKLRRIYAPLVFWMLAALAYAVWREGALTAEPVRAFLLFNVSGQYYFLFVLLLLTAAFYLLRRQDVRTLGWLAVAAFFVSLAAVALHEATDSNGVFAYRDPAVWLFYFAAGFYAGRTGGGLGRLRPYLWLALLLTASAAAVYFVMGEALGRYPVSYFGVTVFLFSCGALVVYPFAARALLASNAGATLLRPFVALSRYAFAIYLVHMPFFIGWLTNHTVSDSAFNRDWLLLMTALFVVGFTGSLAFVMAVARLAPRIALELLLIEPRHERTPGKARAA